MRLVCSSNAVLRLFNFGASLCVCVARFPLHKHGNIDIAVSVPVLGMFIDTHCDYLNGAVVVLVLGMWLA